MYNALLVNNQIGVELWCLLLHKVVIVKWCACCEHNVSILLSVYPPRLRPWLIWCPASHNGRMCFQIMLIWLSNHICISLLFIASFYGVYILSFEQSIICFIYFLFYYNYFIIMIIIILPLNYLIFCHDEAIDLLLTTHKVS